MNTRLRRKGGWDNAPTVTISLACRCHTFCPITSTDKSPHSSSSATADSTITCGSRAAEYRDGCDGRRVCAFRAMECHEYGAEYGGGHNTHPGSRRCVCVSVENEMKAPVAVARGVPRWARCGGAMDDVRAHFAARDMGGRAE